MNGLSPDVKVIRPAAELFRWLAFSSSCGTILSYRATLLDSDGRWITQRLVTQGCNTYATEWRS